MPRNCFRIVAIALCAFILAAPFLTALPTRAEGPGPNLLVDGDFEAPPTWPQQDGIGEVQVAPGWRAYYLDHAPSYVQVPINCSGPKQRADCYWMRPEFRDNTAFANRTRSGLRSQKYFSFGRMHEAGLMQTVGGITPGSIMHFSIYTQAWQCYNPDKCGKNGIKSDQPADMHLRVGIDPTGGRDPFSPNIVWSAEQPAFDRWVEFSVEAVARSNTVTVFTHSRPEWTYARLDNDVYLDDASLVVVSGQAARRAAPAAPKPTTTPVSPLPLPAKPPAAGSTSQVYIVVPGDTLAKIAARYNTTVQAIAQLNNIKNVNLIFTGQKLLIPSLQQPALTP